MYVCMFVCTYVCVKSVAVLKRKKHVKNRTSIKRSGGSIKVYIHTTPLITLIKLMYCTGYNCMLVGTHYS